MDTCVAGRAGRIPCELRTVANLNELLEYASLAKAEVEVKANNNPDNAPNNNPDNGANNR